MEDTASAGNETSKANCTNDYCVSDEQYLDMIRDYIRNWAACSGPCDLKSCVNTVWYMAVMPNVTKPSGT